MKSRKPSQNEAPAPRATRLRALLYSLIALLTLAGLADTTYLTAMHLSGANVVCLGSATCSQVLQSPYSSFHGVPLAALGAFGYFFAFSCAVLAAFRYPVVPEILVALVGIMLGTTLWLLYLQARVLHAFCDYCLFSAALVFLLAGILLFIPRPVPTES